MNIYQEALKSMAHDELVSATMKIQQSRMENLKALKDISRRLFGNSNVRDLPDKIAAIKHAVVELIQFIDPREIERFKKDHPDAYRKLFDATWI